MSGFHGLSFRESERESARRAGVVKFFRNFWVFVVFLAYLSGLKAELRFEGQWNRIED